MNAIITETLARCARLMHEECIFELHLNKVGYTIRCDCSCHIEQVEPADIEW